MTQFNELRTQISNLANDTEFQGLNLVNSSANSLTVEFSTSTSSTLTIDGVDITLTRAGGTGLTVAAAASFSRGDEHRLGAGPDRRRHHHASR